MNASLSFSEVLDLCMARIERGESVEACVADYPEYGEELRDELQAASLFNRAFAFPIDQDRKRAARLRMHAALDRKAARRFHFGLPMPGRLVGAGSRIAVLAAVAVLALVFSGTGTVLASQRAMPGDVLYPVKRTTEQVQLALAFTDGREASVRERLIERRTDELEQLAAEGSERHVAALVSDLAVNLDRVRELATSPVEEAVAPEGQPVDQPTSPPATPGAPETPGPTPTLTPDGNGRSLAAVAITPMLDLKGDLGRLEARLQSFEERFASLATKEQLDRLQRAITENQEKIDQLLERADRLDRGGEPIDRPDDPPVDQDDPSAPTVTPTPQPTTDPAEGPTANGRRQATVTGVDAVLNENGELTQINIKAVLRDDGSPLLIEVKRGGTRLIKDGEPAGLRALAIGQTLMLGIDNATGEVRVAAILEGRGGNRGDSDGRDGGRGDSDGRDPGTGDPVRQDPDPERPTDRDRQEPDEPSVTVEPTPVQRGTENVRLEEVMRRLVQRARESADMPNAGEPVRAEDIVRLLEGITRDSGGALNAKGIEESLREALRQEGYEGELEMPDGASFAEVLYEVLVRWDANGGGPLDTRALAEVLHQALQRWNADEDREVPDVELLEQALQHLLAQDADAADITSTPLSGE